MGVDEKTLGKSLQVARKQAGLTQEELCQKTGLSYSTLAKIERGAIKSPSIFTVAAIAQATGASFEQLLGIKANAGKKMSKTGIKFVYFDLNGVLVRFFYAAFTKIAHDAKTSVDAVEALFWKHNSQLCSGDLTIEKFNQIMAAELGLKNFDWQKYYLASVKPMPGIKEVIDWASKHYEIGIITNSAPSIVDKLRKNGVIPKAQYRAIIDSSVVKCAKPSAKIYQIAQNAAGVRPDEILLIDDTQANIVGASKVGWKVQWFDNFEPNQGIKRIKDTLAF